MKKQTIQKGLSLTSFLRGKCGFELNIKTILLAFGLLLRGSASTQVNFPLGCGMKGQNPPAETTTEFLQNCNNSFTDFLANHADDMIPQNIAGKVRIRTNVIFVQDLNGEGNFSINNSTHMDMWSQLFAILNTKLEQLVQEPCACTATPVHYDNIHIEFVPNFIEIRDNFSWDHRNDPAPNTFNSFNKQYLNYINTLAEQTLGYQPGFNVHITTDGLWYNEFVNNNPENKPLWELGYQHYYSGFWYSAFPTFNLEHPAMWHAPDMYLWYINELEHIGPWHVSTQTVPRWAGTFLHEYGHYFGLGHINCTHNVMRPGGAGATFSSFTGCQARTAYLTLMARNLRKYVICDNALPYNLTVDTDETWRLNMKIFGNVIVKNGATLTITCEVHMPPYGKFIVERGGTLIVDGGLITGSCVDFWSGIIIEGDVPGQQAQSGKVVLQNQAILEYARNSISMNPAYLPWNNGGMQNYFGGLVEAENSTIRNCRRAVEFMKYAKGGIKDKSRFKNVTFENLITGVTIWANDGVIFENCKFKNIDRSAIHPYNSEVIVIDDSQFEKVPLGVDAITTYPIIFASKIGKLGTSPNVFNCYKSGVNIQSGGNVEPLQILNNVFSGGNKGVTQNGNGRLHIYRNQFDGHLTSIELYEGGTSINSVQGNEINESFLGAHSIQQNIGLTYQDNCFFANKLVDIFVSDGDIFPFQGNHDIAASNCFTKSGIPEIDNGAGTGLVFYYILQGTPTSSCTYPVNSQNIFPQESDDENPLICGTEGLIGEDDDIFCEIDHSLPVAELLQIRDTILLNMTNLPSGGSSLDTHQFFLAKSYWYCLKTIEALIGQKMLKSGSDDPNSGKEAAIEFYTGPEMDFCNKITAYGIMVDYGEYARADAFLGQLTPQTQEELDFITVQRINLDYLAVQPGTYETSETTLSYLYSVGTTNGPLNGYARSLYEVLTGERIAVEIPEFVISERSAVAIEGEAHQPVIVHAYPNPVTHGTISLTIKNPDSHSIYQAQLTNGMGLQVGTWVLGQADIHDLDFPRITSGIYILSVTDGSGTVLYRTKLVVLN